MINVMQSFEANYGLTWDWWAWMILYLCPEGVALISVWERGRML